MFRITPVQIVLPALIYTLPLVGQPARLMQPGPWLGLVVSLLILGTQPRVRFQEMTRDTGDRKTALWIHCAVVAGQLVTVASFATRSTATSPAVVLGGILLAAVGLVLRLHAIQILGENFTSLVRVRQDQPVICSGPYKRIRHPSYTGSLLAWLGVSLAMQSFAGALILLAAGIPAYLLRIRAEEQALMAEMGERYRGYCTGTWRLLPFVY